MDQPPATPSITVLIAAYNAEGFLSRAIDSALAQTHPAAEILVVDDASTDGTVALIQSHADRDARVRLLKMPQNGGPSAARNMGFDHARGEWIAILDADDAFRSDRLEVMVKAIQQRPCDIVFDNFSYYNVAWNQISAPAIHGDKAEIIDALAFIDRARPYRKDADYGLVKPMFRKEFFDSKGLRYPTHSRHGEDFLFMATALIEGARCLMLPDAGYIYTDRTSGFSRTIIDYDAMQDQVAALAGHPAVKDNAAIRRALFDKIHAIRRLIAERKYRQMRREKKYLSILGESLSSPDMREFLIFSFMTKLKADKT